MSNIFRSPNKIGWLKTFSSGLCQDNDGNFLPWMCYDLIEHLDQTIKKSDVIFEFGFGTSTFFFAKRAKKVISIESNKRWHDIMKEKLREQNIKNVEIILMQDALTNSDYEKSAAFLTSKHKQKFDLIIVDSLKRAKCMTESITALQEGGRILLDDSQRNGYEKIFDFMKDKNFEAQEFRGIAPGQIKEKKGVIFEK